MMQITRLQELAATNPYFASKLELLNPLPYPVYFVNRNPKWQDLLDNPASITDAQALYQRCVKTNDIWSVQPYLDLKLRGLNVHLVSKAISGKICVIPHYFCRPKDLLYRSYVVACYHDCPHAKLCEQRLVINRSQVLDETYHFITHRPQPNLKPRNPMRGTQIRNVVFKGYDHSLYAPFKSSEFVSALDAIGMKLVINSEATGANMMADWADYTETDVLLAVRNNTVFDILRKPALKLVNAWFAGCPAILGPEPAFQEIRQSELDYIEVRTPEEAIAALKRLQSDPDLYLAMVENGFKRAQDYTVNRVALEWRDLLAGPIAEGYKQWCNQSLMQKYIGRPIQYAKRVIEQRLADKEYQHHIHHGPRIL
uniref:Glycosyltransferase family 1 protein n=1 Tax=Oscillatoriales cyanobacterium SpSt-402 TaxID=2282168 RepID=A0A832H299_9CYAN